MKIFISYRRDDSAGYAGRLFDYLTAHFGERNVFMDIDTIEPGDDFRKVVKNAVGSCDVVLVMIGKQWLSIADGRGRRLDDPRDWVRVEIATALANPSVRVVPVLVRGASMPGEYELPDDLKELSWRNALELSDSRFQHDAGKLVSVIERTGERPAAGRKAVKRKTNAARGMWIFLGLIGLGLAIGGGLYGLRYFGAAAITTPSLTIPPSETMAVTVTPSLPPTFSATATNLPTSTLLAPVPTADVSTIVVQLVDSYFSCINSAVQDRREDFETCWNLLSDRPNEFQDYLNTNSGGFESFYLNYWNKYKVSYALYYCPYLGQNFVDARLVHRDRNNPSVQLTEQSLLEFYFAADDEGWRIVGAKPLDSNIGSDISFYCETQPRVDKLNIFQ